jgi:hypothetical protein
MGTKNVTVFKPVNGVVGLWYFSATFNNISVTMYIVAASFIGGRNLRKPPACRK